MKDSKSSISSFINIVMELKKCCNHGFLVRFPETSDTLNKSRFEVVIIHYHTIPQLFYGPFSGTTRVSQCQKRTFGLHGARED